MNRLLILCVLTAILAGSVCAQDAILINSRDWKDVYSGMLYSSLIDLDAWFILSQDDAVLKVNLIPPTYSEILTLESERNRYYVGLEGLVESRGLEAEVISTRDSLNLELADVSDDYIVVSDQYGYNAISVIPYALQTDSYVLFANRDNIDDIVDVLEDAESVMVYGVLDREVRAALERFSPITIDEGSRIANNQEIAARFLENNDVGQAWLVSGDVLVKPIFEEKYPILFVGRSTVPLEVDAFVLEHNITSLVLQGNELVPMVSQFKQRFENNHYKIIVTILIGRSARQIDFSGDQIEAVDSFRVPVPRLGIIISSIFYNQLERRLEVTYLNEGEAPLYFRSTITLNGDDGIQTSGDEASIFLSGGRSKTMVYPLDLTDEESSARFSVVFGEDRGTLDNLITQTFDPIEFITIEDNSEVRINAVKYDRFNNALFIEVENSGDVTAYADIELDLLIDGIEQTLFAKDILKLEEGGIREVIIRQRLSSLDLADNQEVTGRAFYSQRPESLVNTFEDQFPLGTVIAPAVYATGIGALVVLTILIVLFIIFWRRRKKEAYY
jgi:hypothetical protein